MLHFRSTTGGPSDLTALLFIFLAQLLVFNITNVYLAAPKVTNTLAGDHAAYIFRDDTGMEDGSEEAEAEEATMAESGATTIADA